MKIDPANLDFREAHHLLAGAVTPRPILLISTIGEDGVFNVAPFSFAAPVSVMPPLIGIEFSTRRDGRKKDTLLNIEVSKEFVVNVVVEDLAEAMNRSSADFPRNVDEFKEAGLTPVPATLVKAPMVKEAPIHLECRLLQNLEFGRAPHLSNFIIGEVLVAHVPDGLWVDGDLRSLGLKVLGRMGSDSYIRTTGTIALDQPSGL